MKKSIVIAFILLVAIGVFGCLNMTSVTPQETQDVKLIEHLHPVVLQNDKAKVSVPKVERIDINDNTDQVLFEKANALQIVKDLLGDIYNKQKVDFLAEKELLKYLKETNDEQVYQFIIETLESADIGNESADRLIEYSLSLLAAVDSRRASELFFTFVGNEELQGSNAVYLVSKSISKLARNANYTDLVQQAFSQVPDTSPFLRELAIGIAYNAKPEQVVYLISHIDGECKIKSTVASQAMNKIQTESLVPHIASYISDSSTKKVHDTALNSLANMGQYEAASALISWSSKQPKGSVNQVEKLFNIALRRSPSAKRAIDKEIHSQVFVSEGVRKLIINMSNDGIKSK
jgi:hypothetical protein